MKFLCRCQKRSQHPVYHDVWSEKFRYVRSITGAFFCREGSSDCGNLCRSRLSTLAWLSSFFLAVDYPSYVFRNRSDVLSAFMGNPTTFCFHKFEILSVLDPHLPVSSIISACTTNAALVVHTPKIYFMLDNSAELATRRPMIIHACLRSIWSASFSQGTWVDEPQITLFDIVWGLLSFDNPISNFGSLSSKSGVKYAEN